MRALITRPQEDAADLAAALHARGIEPLVEPLLQIKPVPGASIDLDQVQALLFTSANGVRAFAALSDRRDLPAFTVGEKSADVASTGADTLLAGDLGCLMNMAGKLQREGSSVRVRHVAEVLAGMGDLAPIGEPDTGTR